MGQVFKAEHLMMHKIVAIKILHQDIGDNAEMLQRFRREAQSAAAISHSNICTVMDFDVTENGDFYLVMEFLEGDTLQKRLKDNGPLPPAKAIFIMQQLLSVLQCAHDHGIVHRDVKPENIALVFQDGIEDFVKLLDFGIAHQDKLSPLATHTSDSEFKTQMGFLYGTPEYVAPEQAEGDEIDFRVDLYACGIILYEMLTGHVPFHADSIIRVLNMQVYDAPPHLDVDKIEHGKELDEIIQKLLEKDREKRFQSALAVSEALAGVLLTTNPTMATCARFQTSPNIQPDEDVFDKAADVARTGYRQFAATTPGAKIVDVFRRMSPRMRKIVIASAGILVVAVILSALFATEPALEEVEIGADVKLEKIEEIQPFVYESDFTLSNEETLRKDPNLLKAVESYYQKDYQTCYDNIVAVQSRYVKHPNYLRLRLQAATKHLQVQLKAKKSDQIPALIDDITSNFIALADLVPDAPRNDAVLDALQLVMTASKNKVDPDTTRDALIASQKPSVAIALGWAILYSPYDAYESRKKLMFETLDAFPAAPLPDWMVYALDAWRLDKNACDERGKRFQQAFQTKASREDLFYGILTPLYRNLRLDKKKSERQNCKSSLLEKRDCNACLPWIQPTYESWLALEQEGNLRKAEIPTL